MEKNELLWKIGKLIEYIDVKYDELEHLNGRDHYEESMLLLDEVYTKLIHLYMHGCVIYTRSSNVSEQGG